MRVRLRYILAFTLLATAGVGGSALLWLSMALNAPGPLAESRAVFIPPGSGAGRIALVLRDEGALENPLLFKIAVRLQGSGENLKAGEYMLPLHASINGIVELMQAGKTLQRQVTIAEGLTSREIVDIVNAAEAMEGTVTDIPPEGTLLPETYSYVRGGAREEIISRMRRGMEQALESLWEGRAEGLPVSTPREAIILASVVEKETGVAVERARVAGVFVNRLKIGMPLQSDPTVIYAMTLGKAPLGRAILRRDLDVDSPYNTYKNPGLPPGPIANPGRASLEAVLHPEKHNFIYFVADGTGGHAFAASHEDHLKNVAAWRRINKKN